MKIDKTTFKEGHAWLVIKDKYGNYLGTWHTTNLKFIDAIKKEQPKYIKLLKEEVGN